MKGGRLHRPEPHAHPVAAAPAPADDWVDDSWTVDCSCGVTFDDGEEMVSCDECSVWVHTRCARYVRGVHTSFSCHNCRSKRAPSSADEAEVAELLAEMPTHRPPPLCRRWAEVPLPSRVHVHGLPGGGDSALFRGSPAFSAALWRCTGYVPKRFGFRYYEFPSWADDKDNGADALFALAREKPWEMSDSVLIGSVEPKKEKNYIRSLSCRGNKIDSGQHTLPHLKEAKKRECGTQEDRCRQREGEAVPDIVHEDHYVATNMVSSGLQSVKTNNKTEELLKRCGETKCLKEMLNNTERKDRLKVEVAAIEQEVHSVLVGMEVSMHKQQAEVKEGLKSGRMNSGPNKMQNLQKQSNLTSSLEDVDVLTDLHNVQAESHNIKKEPCCQGNDTAVVVQLASDDPECDQQVLRDTAGSSMAQKISLKSTYVSLCCEHPKSETGNPRMDKVTEHPNSHTGVAKGCTSFSGTVSIPCELSQAVDKELSSTRNMDRLEKKELASPTEIKHDMAKFSEESSQEIIRSSEKGQEKGSFASTPKSYQESRIYTPAVKPRLSVSKEQLQKTATTSTSAKSFHGESPPLQSRNKAVASSSSQRKDKINQRTIYVTQEGANNSTSTELRACDSTASLSDEQLALLLHQQLNSSPRVPRVPRCHQAAGSQMLHPPGATVFSKRSSVHGGRDHGMALKKRNRDDTLKDSEDRRTEKTYFVERRHRDSSVHNVSSLKDSCRSADNVASQQRNHGICSTGANTGLTDDSMDNIVSRNLPGLIDEIICKNRSITHEELCDAVHQHFRDLRKVNEEDYTFPTLLRSINDCLRKRREWAHLVDQVPKTCSSKHLKGESNSLLDDALPAEKMRPERNSEDGSTDLHQEDLPRGRRKARKRRRLELKGRRVRDTRKRSSIDSSEDATAILSDSSSDRNDTPMDDVNQEDYSVASRIGSYMEAKDADPSS